MAKDSTKSTTANDSKVQADLSKQESQRGGLDGIPTTPGPLSNDPGTLEKAFSPAGDSGRQGTTIDDPSKPGRLDPVEVAKGNDTSDGGGQSQTSSALTGAGTDGEPKLTQVKNTPKPTRAPQFKVMNPQRITVGWKGGECRLDPGSLISEDSYGDGAVEMFRNAGVLLEEVK